jgi:hypothetical protein
MKLWKNAFTRLVHMVFDAWLSRTQISVWFPTDDQVGPRGTWTKNNSRSRLLYGQG